MAIRVERSAGLVTITIDRPAKKNAIDSQTWVELDRAFAEVAQDPDDRALILTGAGGNFSAGADLSGGQSEQGVTGHRVQPIVQEMRAMGDVVMRLHRIPKPTLAKVDGVAVGVGLGFVLACDLVVASDRARFSEIFAKRGLALDGGNSWLLPRLVGLNKAKELAFRLSPSSKRWKTRRAASTSPTRARTCGKGSPPFSSVESRAFAAVDHDTRA